MSEFVIYHPGTGTFVAASECVLIDAALLPAEFDEWEDFLSDNPEIVASAKEVQA